MHASAARAGTTGQPVGHRIRRHRPRRPPSGDREPGFPGRGGASGQDQSDPVLTLTEGRYFLYTSGVPGSPPVNVPVASATDFGDWSPITDALPVLPRWAVPGYTWAPDVHRFGSSYVLYFTAMVVLTKPAMECIGIATGTAPDGPFTPASTPFICQVDQGGSIDPRVFTDADGTNWMLWKSDQNIGGANTPTKMWSQRLSSDGLGLVGRPALLMGPDEPWQGTIVEAPDMVEVDGDYWVFYSGNWFNQPTYAIGAARCAGPPGPCADIVSLPLLGSNDQGQGPGEASVFADSSGVWMLYSPWRSLAPHPDFLPTGVHHPDRVHPHLGLSGRRRAAAQPRRPHCPDPADGPVTWLPAQSAQLGGDRLAVGLALGGLHHLAGEEPGQLVLARRGTDATRRDGRPTPRPRQATRESSVIASNPLAAAMAAGSPPPAASRSASTALAWVAVSDPEASMVNSPT